MPWYHVRLSLNDLATGKHIRLHNAFESLWLDSRTRTGAAMFGNADVQNDYTYYFSPPCTRFFAEVLAAFGASICPPPVRESVVLLVGDPEALGDGMHI